MLDALGLDKKDAEGYRLRKDGKRLSIVDSVFTSGGQSVPMDRAELVKKHLKAVGIELIPKSVDRTLWVPLVHGLEHDVADYAANLGFFGNPPIIRETFMNMEGNQHMGTQWGLYAESGGTKGEEPPAEVKKLWELYDKTMADTSGAKRNEYQTQALDMWAQNIWAIAFTQEPALGRYCIVKNNFRGVPEKAYDVETLHTATMYFKK